MKVKGVVINAEDHSSIAGARIVLRIEERELAVLYSDNEGRIEHGETTSRVGKTLVCRVEKDGFQNATETRVVEQDEITFQVELVPLASEKPNRAMQKEAAAHKQSAEKAIAETDVTLQLHLTNKKGAPVPNVTVTCEVRGFKVGNGVSGSDGVVQMSLARLEHA